MDICDLDNIMIDLMQKYDDGDCTAEEIFFLNNLRANLNDLLG